MLFKTEREQANLECENICSVLKESLLNYRLTDTPFSISIHIKKSFLQDRSMESSEVFVPSSTPASNTSLITSSPCTPSIFPQSLDVNQDSGIQNEQLNDVRKELVKNIVESNQEKADLKDKLTKSNTKVQELESKLKIIEEQKKAMKVERDNKSEQLKQKNKNLEAFKNKLEVALKEKDTIQNNFSNKVLKLEDKINHLTEVNQQKSKDLKTEQRKLKKIEGRNEKSKTIKKISKECQTLSQEFSSCETQTSFNFEPTLLKSISTSLFNSTPPEKFSFGQFGSSNSTILNKLPIINTTNDDSTSSLNLTSARPSAPKTFSAEFPIFSKVKREAAWSNKDYPATSSETIGFIRDIVGYWFGLASLWKMDSGMEAFLDEYLYKHRRDDGDLLKKL